MTVKRDEVGAPFGHIDADAMIAVERSLAAFSQNREMMAVSNDYAKRESKRPSSRLGIM
jgi:hypothetical protein